MEVWTVEGSSAKFRSARFGFLLSTSEVQNKGRRTAFQTFIARQKETRQVKIKIEAHDGGYIEHPTI
jgi:hypothetical protein